jgi:hypothetical protein
MTGHRHSYQPAGMGRRFLALFSCLCLLLSLMGCGMCGCNDSDADAATLALARAVAGPGQVVAGVTLSIDTHLFADDEFTLTVRVQNPPPATGFTEIESKGTFKKSGDTVTFTITNGVTTLLQGGAKYTLTCKNIEGKKVIVLQRQGLLTPALVFVCH